MNTRVLVAGATGRLGMRLVRRLHAAGFRVRIIARDAARIGLLKRHVSDVVEADLTGAVPVDACRDIDVVVSCAGASTSLFVGGDVPSFDDVNHRGNARLLDAAAARGVGRFIHIAALGTERLQHTAYGAAHERFIERLRRSDVAYTVIRATGYYSYVAEALRLLHAGAGWQFGTGGSRTNPIHEGDLAEFCTLAMVYSREPEITVGGPETWTRDEIHDLARRIVARTSPLRVPAAIARGTDERVDGLLEFGSAVSTLDVVGTPCGTQKLGDYLEACAAAWRPRTHAA